MNKTIMILEDEQHFHTLYEAMLEDTGCEIISTCDGYDALSKLEEKKPDLIILDILLDIMPGDTFFLYLKGMSEYADIPVIINSSLSEKRYKNLKKIDPNLVCIEKSYLARDRLLDEIEKKLSYSSHSAYVVQT